MDIISFLPKLYFLSVSIPERGSRCTSYGRQLKQTAKDIITFFYNPAIQSDLSFVCAIQRVTLSHPLNKLHFHAHRLKPDGKGYNHIFQQSRYSNRPILCRSPLGHGHNLGMLPPTRYPAQGAAHCHSSKKLLCLFY